MEGTRKLHRSSGSQAGLLGRNSGWKLRSIPKRTSQKFISAQPKITRTFARKKVTDLGVCALVTALCRECPTKWAHQIDLQSPCIVAIVGPTGNQPAKIVCKAKKLDGDDLRLMFPVEEVASLSSGAASRFQGGDLDFMISFWDRGLFGSAVSFPTSSTKLPQTKPIRFVWSAQSTTEKNRFLYHVLQLREESGGSPIQTEGIDMIALERAAAEDNSGFAWEPILASIFDERRAHEQTSDLWTLSLEDQQLCLEVLNTRWGEDFITPTTPTPTSTSSTPSTPTFATPTISLAPTLSTSTDQTSTRYCDTSELCAELENQLLILENKDRQDLAVFDSPDAPMVLVVKLSEVCAEMETLRDWMVDFAPKLLEQLKFVEEQNTTLDVQTKNHRALLSVLDSLLAGVSLPEEKTSVLRMPSFRFREDIENAVSAAQALIATFESTENPTLCRMAVLQNKVKQAEALNTFFCDSAKTHLVAEFQKAANLDTSKPIDEHTLRTSVSSLNRFSELLSCVAQLSPPTITTLRQEFAKAFAPKYGAYVKNLISTFRNEHLVVEAAEVRLGMMEVHPIPSAAVVAASVSTIASPRGQHGTALGMVSPRRGSQTPQQTQQTLQQKSKGRLGDTDSLSEFAEHANQLFVDVLSPLCMEIERLVKDLLCLDPEEHHSRGGVRGASQADVLLDIMDQLVGQTILLEISSLVSSVAKQNPFALVGLVVGAAAMVSSSTTKDQVFALPDLKDPTKQPPGRKRQRAQFISIEHFAPQWKQLAEVNLIAFVDKQIAAMNDAKYDARRAGVLAPVLRFPGFYKRLLACAADKEDEVKPEIAKLCQALFTLVRNVAHSNTKYTDIVMLENTFHIWWFLTSTSTNRAINSDLATEALSLFDLHCRKYCSWITQCQFGAVFEFFDELETLAGAMEVTDILFQEKFSRTAFRALVDVHLTSSCMRAAISQMHKRVDKHISEESGLKSLVWKMVYERLLEAYEKWEGLVSVVYRPTTLDLKLDDVEMQCVRV